MKVHATAILIHEREVGHCFADLRHVCLRSRTAGCGRRVLVDGDVGDISLVGADGQGSMQLISRPRDVEDPFVLNAEWHRHARHVAGDFLVLQRDLFLWYVDGDDFAFDWITPDILRLLRLGRTGCEQDECAEESEENDFRLVPLGVSHDDLRTALLIGPTCP